ncbi:MAG: hypothetical protein KDC98_16495 [Planctomycetes bacterium]|nr:hypothetical protein [Planctomycetota bacterium]
MCTGAGLTADRGPALFALVAAGAVVAPLCGELFVRGGLLAPFVAHVLNNAAAFAVLLI